VVAESFGTPDAEKVGATGAIEEGNLASEVNVEPGIHSCRVGIVSDGNGEK
jgi:hypothetical protein